MKLPNALKNLALISILAMVCPVLHAKAIHSYTDENGNLVYFNVPQKHTDIDGVPQIVPEVAAAPLGTGLKPASSSPSAPYENFITKYSKANSVDPDLVRAVMATESGFNPVAVSNKGACGLMQLIPSTARRFGVVHVFRPEENIEGGIKYLRFLLDTFKNDVKLVVAAYNAGENAVKRIGGIPHYRETINYVNRIVARYGDTYRPAQGAAAPPPSPEETLKALSKIYRIVDGSGNVFYTNRPTSE